MGEGPFHIDDLEARRIRARVARALFGDRGGSTLEHVGPHDERTPDNGVAASAKRPCERR